MRISQLAAESGVSVPSIKFYLREGLMHDGVLTSATQAEYDGSHVQRLRLIRALLGPAGLSIAGAHSLLGTMEHPPEHAHDLLGAAHAANAPTGAAIRDDLDAVRAEAASWGWDVSGCDPLVLSALGDALESLRDADFTVPPSVMRTYVDAMKSVASAEIAEIPTDSAEAAVRYVVLGTILVEPLLLAMRRLAQETASLERFRGAPPGELDARQSNSSYDETPEFG